MSIGNDKHRYDYMLNMPHKQSSSRKHMTMIERAAQFGAFRALTGYEDAILETGRLTKERVELDEYQKIEIDMKLQFIKDNVETIPEVSITYFMPDEKKCGGEYVTHVGSVKKIREFEKQLVFEDGTEIPLEEIFDIEGEFFSKNDFE